MEIGVCSMSGAAARTGKFKKKRKSNIRNQEIREYWERNTKTCVNRRDKKKEEKNPP